MNSLVDFLFLSQRKLFERLCKKFKGNTLVRKGKNDAVFYRCANPNFETYISDKGFKTAQGSFSDISVVALELELAAVNLSSGYYHAHTLHEYINRAELDDIICKVVDIISDVPHLPRFEYVECIQSIEQPKLVPRVESLSLPRRISASLRDIYKILLDFYSVNELEAFRAEYGEQILRQIYNEEIVSFY